ncbi:MAG TPA: O-antigen ligase family protein [Anaerolineales bacterium]|nr:O-antigen ligase family protein [Anaerolineales bacterium]
MRKIAFVLSLILSFMIPWEGVLRIPGIGNGSKLMGFLLAVFWLATLLVTRQLRRPGPFQMAFFFFVLWNASSVFWSVNPHKSLNQLVTWIQLLALVFIWWDLYTTRTAVLAGLQAYILGSYVAIGSALINYAAGSSFYPHFSRYSPGQTNPDGFGFLMALGIPVAWYLATSQGANRMSSWWKFVNYVYILAALIGIVLSGTRTALIASAFGMAFGLASLTRLQVRTRIAIFVFLTSVIVVLLPYVQTLESFQRFSTIGPELTQGTLHNRTNNWREGLLSFVKHPVLGVGANMYPSVNSWDKAAHNTFLAVLVELGIIGLALFGTVLGIAVSQALKQPKWEAWFWMTVFTVWFLGSSTLTWGPRKSTWLFLSFLVASTALTTIPREEPVSLMDGSERELVVASRA